MTNRQKFIQVMNDTFGAGLTEENMNTFFSDCSPCGLYKEGCEERFTCNGCADWWARKYEEPEGRRCCPPAGKGVAMVKHYGDITKISGYMVEPVDVITGGSPC